MYLPDLNTFCHKTETGNLVPVFRELSADLETPVSVFLKLKNDTPCFLLESVERGEQLGRYSFIGTNPFLIFQAQGTKGSINDHGKISKAYFDPPPSDNNPLREIQRLLSQYKVAAVPELPRFFGGAVGYLSYDMVRFFEKLPPSPKDQLKLPDCVFLFTDTLVIFDHVANKMKIVSNAMASDNDSVAYQEAVDKIEDIISILSQPLTTTEPARTSTPDDSETPQLSSNFTSQEFNEAVKVAKEHILNGDAFQIVLSQRLCRQTTAQPFSIYRALRMLNPSPYMFYLDFSNFQLIGSSPEMLVKLEGNQAETRPIAGTRPRGNSEDKDELIITELLADPKERAEHVMLVDLGRNDLGRVCRFGTVETPLFMTTEKYSHVIHIVSSVTGELQEKQNAFDLLHACFPAGTVTGAPKIRAMEIINELEGVSRGPYAGAVGYFSFTGNMDTCITIRTIVQIGNTVYLQGGAGIVADSDPEREYLETLKKMEVLQKAVNLAETR
ncbi:MAG TPA: anthranilate synthase component I [Dehalococcoidia bacterium]|nr:anthranilate synthase component I [Dehalococcoidia bacterium]